MNDINKIMRRILADVEVGLGDEFDRNFERQAFFSEKWQRRKNSGRDNGRAILTQSGALRKSIQSRISGDSIVFYSDLPYAGIHNEGGEIKVTARMKRYFWHKYMTVAGVLVWARRKDGSMRHDKNTRTLSAEADFYKAMALKKTGSTIVIPKRQFLGVSPEVEKAVRDIIEGQLAEYFGNEFKLLNNK